MEVQIIGDDSRNISGYFSFTLYYRGNIDSFKKSKYYVGLNMYKRIIEDSPFFSNIGMIIYTDIRTVDMLRELYGGSPKIIIAVVRWPEFELAEGEVNTGVLRCARYNAIAQFPDRWICVRDADTLFTEYYEDVFDESIWELMGSWEEAFIRRWLSMDPQKIVIGANANYIMNWHTNMPFKNRLKFWFENEKQSFFVKQHTLKKRLKRNYGDDANLPYFSPPLGLYAGFVNFPAGYSEIWTKCVEFLRSRYFFTNSAGERHNNSRSMLIPPIGKDERLLLYVIVPEYIDSIYFYNIQYVIPEENNVKKLTNEDYINSTFNSDWNLKFQKIFRKMIQDYNIWKARKTPESREKNYINTVRGYRMNKKYENLFYVGGVGGAQCGAQRGKTRKRKNAGKRK